jgi:A nuclease of the HNH/ENDO VII superfamily with conserved WHH
MGVTDFLTPTVGGITAPQGNPDALRGAARTFSAAAEVAEAHLRRIDSAANSVVPSGWFGIAAWAFRFAVGSAASDLRPGPGAFRTAAGALETLATEIQAAQEAARRAQARAADLNGRSARLDQAFDQATAIDANGPDVAALPGLVLQAGALQLEALAIQGEATAAAERAQEAARTAAAEFDAVTAMAPSVKRAIREYLEEHTEEAEDRGLIECGVDEVKETGGLLGGLLNPFGDSFGESWSNLGKGTWWLVTHPVDGGKMLIGLDTLQNEGADCWIGEAAPGLVLTVLSGGAGAAGRAGTVANRAEDVAGAASDVRRVTGVAETLGDARKVSQVLDEVVPADAVRRVNGRNPINSQYAGQVYHLAGDLGQRYPNGVAFTREGFPDFSPYAVAESRITMTGNRAIDERLANQARGLRETPDGYTWHHVEDTETMLLVPRDLHDTVRHTGGVAVLRDRARQTAPDAP